MRLITLIIALFLSFTLTESFSQTYVGAASNAPSRYVVTNQVQDVSMINLTVVGKLNGTRELLSFGKTSGGLTNFYSGVAALTTTTNLSIAMIRNGSVMGFSTRANVTAHTTGGDVWCEVWINDTITLSNKFTTTATGGYTTFATTNRNVYPFVAGDTLTVYHRYVGFAGTIGNCYDTIEIVNDD